MGRRVLALAVLCAIGACAGPVAPSAAPSPPPAIVRVTADQVVRAMAADSFFADYGQATLVIDGRVGSVSATDLGSRLALVTATSAVVICETVGAPSVNAGATIQVRARATDAQRDPAGVLLRHCEIAAP